MKRDLPVAVFDSGVGGLSVLVRCRMLMPRENYLYYADSAHFPYGSKPAAAVRIAALKAVAEMAERGIKGLVVACNTATSAAVRELRRLYSFPILGMEPALKPAAEFGGRIAVIATELTLKEEKFQKLFEQNGGSQVVLLPAPGLADLVEAGGYNKPEAEAYLRRLFAGVGPLDAIVLGCTHYAFLLPQLRIFYPDVEIFEGSGGTVRYLHQRLAEEGLLTESGSGHIQVTASGGPAFTQKFPCFLQDISEIFAIEAHRLK